MSRLASVLAVALVALRAAPARAEPLDLDLSRLGPPDPAVWTLIETETGTPLTAPASVLADDAKKRFAVLSSEFAMLMSGPMLQPASTTGHVGFDAAFEVAYQPVHADAVGIAQYGFTTSPWATRGDAPSAVTTTGVHVRKAFPWSIEIGGRLTNVNKASYFAAQGEVKWALNEGFEKIPDFAVRLAYTRLFGQEHWNLGATDLDFMMSKRWGVSAVTSFTPYFAFRYTFVNASSDAIDFRSSDPATTPASEPPTQQYAGVAAFPNLHAGLFRTTAGVRMTASVVSLALEATYLFGNDIQADDYPEFSVHSSFATALKLGWEF
jgi:hypothetical protein